MKKWWLKNSVTTKLKKKTNTFRNATISGVFVWRLVVKDSKRMGLKN